MTKIAGSCPTAFLRVGLKVTGENVPADTHILSIESCNSFTTDNDMPETGIKTFYFENASTDPEDRVPSDLSPAEYTIDGKGPLMYAQGLLDAHFKIGDKRRIDKIRVNITGMTVYWECTAADMNGPSYDVKGNLIRANGNRVWTRKDASYRPDKFSFNLSDIGELAIIDQKFGDKSWQGTATLVPGYLVQTNHTTVSYILDNNDLPGQGTFRDISWTVLNVKVGATGAPEITPLSGGDGGDKGSGAELDALVPDTSPVTLVNDQPVVSEEDIWTSENWIGHVTDVGSFTGSESFYGTFDQFGNVNEWTGEVIEIKLNGVATGFTGSTVNISIYSSLWSYSRPMVEEQDPRYGGYYIGFRLASSSMEELPDMVPVGNPGNAAKESGLLVPCGNSLSPSQALQARRDAAILGAAYDSSSVCGNPARDAGSVSYEYQIGKYAVTVDQYTEFLNAVAATDPVGGLYSTLMNTTVYQTSYIPSISRSGTNGGYVYAVLNSAGNHPVEFVSFDSCARFCNWMSNGKPSGAQDGTTTENGAYNFDESALDQYGQPTLLSVSNLIYTVNDINPNTGLAPTYRMPTIDEWYKAGYYSPNRCGSGVGGYWSFATQSETPPGTTIGSDSNQANYLPKQFPLQRTCPNCCAPEVCIVDSYEPSIGTHTYTCGTDPGAPPTTPVENCKCQVTAEPDGSWFTHNFIRPIGIKSLTFTCGGQIENPNVFHIWADDFQVWTGSQEEEGYVIALPFETKTIRLMIETQADPRCADNCSTFHFNVDVKEDQFTHGDSTENNTQPEDPVQAYVKSGSGVVFGNITVSSGAITGVGIIRGGADYGSGSNISFTTSNGSGATATIVTSSGIVTSVNITNGGSGYISTNDPEVSGYITASVVDGVGAEFFVVVSPEPSTSISGVNVVGFGKYDPKGGTGYGNGSKIIFTASNGSGATGIINTSNGVITAVTVTNGGSGYSHSSGGVILDVGTIKSTSAYGTFDQGGNGRELTSTWEGVNAILILNFEDELTDNSYFGLEVLGYNGSIGSPISITTSAEKKFGASAMACSGNFAYIAANEVFDFGIGDFTLEAWVYPTSQTLVGGLFSVGEYNDGILWRHGSNSDSLYISGNKSFTGSYNRSGATITITYVGDTSEIGGFADPIAERSHGFSVGGSVTITRLKYAQCTACLHDVTITYTILTVTDTAFTVAQSAHFNDSDGCSTSGYAEITGTSVLHYDWNAEVHAPVGSWTHLALVRNNAWLVDENTNNYRIYANGVNVYEFFNNTVITDPDSPATHDLTIGAGRHNLAEVFNGYIDDVRISSSAVYVEDSFDAPEQLEQDAEYIVRGVGLTGGRTLFPNKRSLYEIEDNRPDKRTKVFRSTNKHEISWDIENLSTFRIASFHKDFYDGNASLKLVNLIDIDEAGNNADVVESRFGDGLLSTKALKKNCGNVHYDFYISALNITVEQYMLFLQANVIDGSMQRIVDLDLIQDQEGANPNLSGQWLGIYFDSTLDILQIRSGMHKKPIATKWHAAARYCNWIHNGAQTPAVYTIVLTGTTTNGSSSVIFTADTDPGVLDVCIGMLMTGTGIDTGASVIDIPDYEDATIIMSAPATASGTVSITFHADTETGSYIFPNTSYYGEMSIEVMSDCWIPTENEWYKAAYYKNGVGGDEMRYNRGYFNYATASNTPPAGYYVQEGTFNVQNNTWSIP